MQHYGLGASYGWSSSVRLDRILVHGTRMRSTPTLPRRDSLPTSLESCISTSGQARRSHETHAPILGCYPVTLHCVLINILKRPAGTRASERHGAAAAVGCRAARRPPRPAWQEHLHCSDHFGIVVELPRAALDNRGCHGMVLLAVTAAVSSPRPYSMMHTSFHRATKNDTIGPTTVEVKLDL